MIESRLGEATRRDGISTISTVGATEGTADKSVVTSDARFNLSERFLVMKRREDEFCFLGVGFFGDVGMVVVESEKKK